MKLKTTVVICIAVLVVMFQVVFAEAIKGDNPKISILQEASFSVSVPQDIEIISNIDNFDKAFLWYQAGDKKGFKSIKMQPSNNFEGFWSATVPEKALRSGYVQYYISAENKSGKVVNSNVQEIAVLPPSEGNVEISASGDWFYDIQYYAGKVLSGNTIPISTMTVKTPIRLSGDANWFRPVTSKLAEIRSVSPNPHNGIDLSVASGTAVYPVLNGFYVRTIASHGLVEIGHGNYNSSTNTYDYYTRYLHMSGIPTFQSGQAVYTNTRIGNVSDVGSPGAIHLDFSFFVKDGLTQRFMPAKFFYPQITEWNSGNDLDFAQPPVRRFDSVYGTYIDINIYPRGTNDSATITATIHWRVKGSTNFNVSTMNSQGGNIYRYYCDSTLDGKDIEYFVEIKRSGLQNPQYRPVMYAPTNSTPQPPNIYYTARVTKGQILP